MKELREITDKVNANLIADIVGHPQGAPSVEELEHMNPSLERDTIQRRLTSLEETALLRWSSLIPVTDKVFQVSSIDSLTEHEHCSMIRGLFPEDAWTRQYDRVQKSGDIKEIQALPRPF